MEKNRLTIEELSVTIQEKEILKNISLTSASSEITMILGTNGVGKTTLFRTIMGMVKPIRGRIYLGEHDVLEWKPKERARKVAYCMQNTGNEIEAFVMDFVLSGLTPYLGIFEHSKKEHELLAKDALAQFGIEELEKRNLIELSGGERQRVYLARTFVQDTEVLLLDEPTSYLDFKTQALFLEAFIEYVKGKEKIALMTVQDPNLALRCADNVVCLNNSEVEIILHPKEGDFRKKAEPCFQKIYGERVILLYDGQYYLKWR